MLETKLECINTKSAWLLMEVNSETPQVDFGKCLSNTEQEQWHSIQHPVKKLEFLAARYALNQLIQKLQFNYEGIIKDECGKPYLVNQSGSISLTHAYPYVAVQWRADAFAGIDMEAIQPKLQKVASRVFCAQELQYTGNNLNKLAAFWCAKEALYKAYGKRALVFKDDLRVRVLPNETSEFLLEGEILKNNLSQKFKLKYLQYNNFGFAYVLDPSIDLM